MLINLVDQTNVANNHKYYTMPPIKKKKKNKKIYLPKSWLKKGLQPTDGGKWLPYTQYRIDHRPL